MLFLRNKDQEKKGNYLTTEGEKDDFTDMMKIGFRSLRKYENRNQIVKGSTSQSMQKRSKSQINHITMSNNQFINNFSSIFQQE
jgi:hypothetical protein